jgi:phosphate-selective porin OprO and OprP
MRKFTIAVALFFTFIGTFGQVKPSPLPYFTFGKGLGITAPDSLFSMNIRFRMQNRFAIKTESGTDLGISEVEARVRRLRLRFDGFVYSPKLTYVIQLSFSRGDMDYESLNFPNIVRDAYVQYAFTKHLNVGLGQTKLPGNRQRINSSGDLQLPDRSIVNATFNIDRDFGIQAIYKKEIFVLRAAVSSGEGRNITASDKGLSYSGRFEFLPFGSFTNGGDYFEGDIAREQKPKLSLAAASSFNENAVRTGGQLGTYLYDGRDISTHIFDVLFKYKGISLSGEYITKDTDGNPITEDVVTGAERYVYTGHGQNYQGGYLFKNNIEVVGRYSSITPSKEILSKEKYKEQFTLGINKYIKGHRVKLQSDLTLEKSYRPATKIDHVWMYRFQIEVGI